MIKFLQNFLSSKSSSLDRQPSSFNISKQLISKVPLLFNHSGNAGDIIFSCALLKSVWKHTGKKVHLHLQTDVAVVYSVEHPLKNILMSRKIAEQLVPALSMQPYIESISISPHTPNEAINLSAFRQLPIDLRTGLIQGWYQLCTDLWIDLFEAWIEAVKQPSYQKTIIVSRTLRLRSDYINYKFLSKYASDILFVGLPEEYTDFRSETGIDCQAITVNSFDQLLNMIHSCRLFIGNQSLACSIAESVKCPRVIESNSIAPNNYPLSSNGRIALFQEQFEHFIKEMLSE